MKKPTGPARVETTATPAGAPVSGFAALLFNFDFDDAAVKAEHQAWLLEHAVPSLTAVPGAKVFLRGMASQIGNRDYNLQLSRRRVEAVAGFLVAQGVARGQIVTAFTGEDLSASKLADDERDRAVEAIFEVSAGAARFERGFPIGADDGFDDGAEPPSIIIPSQAQSIVRLVDGAGAVVESLDPGVVKVIDPSRPGARPVVATSNQFLLVLKPAVPGRTQLVAHFPQASAGSAAFEPASFALFEERKPDEILRRARRSRFPSRQVADRLIVQTLARRKVSVTLHYVTTDGKGGQAPGGVRTARKPTPPLEAQYIAYMNKIYLPQANIEFTLNPSRVVDSNGVSAPAVNAGIGGNRDKIFSTSKADKSAAFRVFFVGDIRNGSLSVAASTLGQDCLCADVLRKAPLDEDVSTVGRILAHEMGHTLGEGDDDRAGREALLMFGEDKGGENIPLEQGTRMNSAAGRRK
jgi:hypothetical protein